MPTFPCMRGLAHVLLLVTGLVPAGAAEGPWQPLFDGTDLKGWETWLAKPPGASEPLGLNHDPDQVFSVSDGCLHITGQVFGGISTLAEYGDYHLRLEQRWGEKKWPPRLDAVRDSGICYHGTGPHGAGSGNWLSSIECQVQEGDTGDCWLVAGPRVEVQAVPREKAWEYREGAPLVAVAKDRIYKSATNEKPHGEWNVIEVICRGDTCTHIVNGTTVMVLSHARQIVGGQEEPLTRGRIQLQSEGAEVWYRKVEISLLTP